jgi:hypothetical protein
MTPAANQRALLLWLPLGATFAVAVCVFNFLESHGEATRALGSELRQIECCFSSDRATGRMTAAEIALLVSSSKFEQYDNVWQLSWV